MVTKRKVKGQPRSQAPQHQSHSPEKAGKRTPRPRPDLIHGQTWKTQTGCGNLYVTLNADERGDLFEVFCKHGKTGGCASAQLEALGVLLSFAIRSDVDPKSLCEGLKGIRCPTPLRMKGGEFVLSCADATARVIEEYLEGKRKILDND